MTADIIESKTITEILSSLGVITSQVNENVLINGQPQVMYQINEEYAFKPETPQIIDIEVK